MSQSPQFIKVLGTPDIAFPESRAFEAPDVEGLRRDLPAAAAEAGLTLGEPSHWELSDVFCDTLDDRFHRAGLSLRLRRQGDLGSAALLPETPVLKALLGDAGIPAFMVDPHPDRVAGIPGTLGDHVRAVAGTEGIHRRYETRTERDSFPLHREGRLLARLRFDTAAVSDGRRGDPEVFHRLTLETDAPDSEPIRRMLAALGALHRLTPTTDSLAGEARRALALGGAPAHAIPGPDRMTPEMTVAEAAFAVLRKHARRCLEREPGTRFGEDPEELHDMRVAVRRMRAALRLYRGLLPDGAEELRAELGWLGRGLGEVRDLDVQIERLRARQATLGERDREALDAVIELLKHRRTEARARMLRLLDSPRCRRCLDALSAWLREGPGNAPPEGREPVLAIAPRLIRTKRRRVMKPGRRLAPGAPPEDYHALRIRTKAWRYALEFHRELYGKPAARMIAALTALQDLLGDHQDATVGVAQMEGMARAEGDRLAPRTLFVMGELAERHRREAEVLRERFPAKFAKLEGKRWRKLARVLSR